MINNLLLSMTSKGFIETISNNEINNIKILEEKKNFYKEKYIKLKYFCHEGVHFELNRDFNNYFVWLKTFINLDFIEMNRENKMDIFNKYKFVIQFFNYIIHLYIDYFSENNILDELSNQNIEEHEDITKNRKYLYDNNNNDNNNNNTRYKKENILNIISKKYDFKIPHILHPEFVFDNFIYHRKSHFFTDEEMIHTEKIFKFFEMIYFTLLNHMEEYEFIITELNKE